MRRHAAAFLRLTWFNSRRLATSPFLLLGAAAAGAMVWSLRGIERTGTAESWYNELSTLAVLVALAMFAAVTPSAVREARHPGTPVAPLGRTARLLALLTAAVLVSCAAQAAGTAVLYHTYDHPLPGVVSPYAVPVPFATAASGAVTGVALASWTRSYLPLLLLALGGPGYVLYATLAASSRMGWTMGRMEQVAYQLHNPFIVQTPSLTGVSLLSLAYALLVLAALAALALAARRRGAVLFVSLGTAVALLAGAAGTALHGRHTYPWGTPIPDSEVYGHSGASPCRELEGITYCPLPGYESWTGLWHSVLGPAMAQLPEEARKPVLWQDSHAYTREMELPPGRGMVVYDHADPGSGYWEAWLITDAARIALNMDFTPHRAPCRATGQARIAVAPWLFDLPDTLSALEKAEITAAYLADHTPAPADLELVRALEELPRERVRQALHLHWDRLVSGELGSVELAEELGVVLESPADTPMSASDWDLLSPLLSSQQWGEGYPVWNADADVCGRAS
ncbi:hypothetical protein ACOALZ_14040 [Nocardiopsis algeriensis]|uniref:hypothetical protein n=1 Tax=Nocardiopsis algeriensis TaxID=1478215 RepID=UPI003B42F618